MFFLHWIFEYLCVDRKKRNMENKPLAERMRPKSLEDYIGQQHLVGPGKVLRKMIDSGVVSSFILWGPPEWGKRRWRWLSRNSWNVRFTCWVPWVPGLKDVREVIQKARDNVSLIHRIPSCLSRNSSIFEGPAGFFAGSRGERYRDAYRGHDWKSFLRGDFPAFIPLSGVRAKVSREKGSRRPDRPCRC